MIERWYKGLYTSCWVFLTSQWIGFAWTCSAQSSTGRQTRWLIALLRINDTFANCCLLGWLLGRIGRNIIFKDRRECTKTYVTSMNSPDEHDVSDNCRMRLEGHTSVWGAQGHRAMLSKYLWILQASQGWQHHSLSWESQNSVEPAVLMTAGCC